VKHKRQKGIKWKSPNQKSFARALANLRQEIHKMLSLQARVETDAKLQARDATEARDAEVKN
jgi:hypothetical protein